MIKYTANYRCETNLFTILLLLFKQTMEYRWQIWLSIKKKIHITYQQDVLGLFWSIVMPIIPMTVYMVLAHIKVFKTVANMPFVYYIGVGMFVWLLMSTTIQTVMKSIKSEKTILKTSTFPLFPVMLSRLGEVLHDTGIRVIAIIMIVFFYKMDTNFSMAVLALLSLIPVIIFSLGLGMLLAIFDIIVQDTRRVVLLLLRYGLFVSSVIFPFPETGIAGAINQFNFFNTYINATRDILHHGYINHLDTFIYTTIVGMIIFIIAAKLVYIMDFKIREYL